MSQTRETPKHDRVDVVFIRKSTREQDESGQVANVESMLKRLGVYVSKDTWFLGTVSRRKVKSNVDFLRLMELVESDRVRTVYVESQDRWGTKDRPELFSLLGTLREHGTKLFDLRDNKDLTERDFATELLAFVREHQIGKGTQGQLLSVVADQGQPVPCNRLLAHGNTPLWLRKAMHHARRVAQMGVAP